MVSNLLEYFPAVFKDIREYQAVSLVETPEIKNLDLALLETMNNQFVLTLNENGCSRWEKILKIKKMDTDTLSDRRFRIQAKLNEQLPYSKRSLETQLANLCGANGYELLMDKQNYKLSIKLDLTQKKQFNSVVELLERITPCNLILAVSLMYNQYQKFSSKTQTAMSTFTHFQLREEVIS